MSQFCGRITLICTVSYILNVKDFFSFIHNIHTWVREQSSNTSMMVTGRSWRFLGVTTADRLESVSLDARSECSNVFSPSYTNSLASSISGSAPPMFSPVNIILRRTKVGNIQIEVASSLKLNMAVSKKGIFVVKVDVF